MYRDNDALLHEKLRQRTEPTLEQRALQQASEHMASIALPPAQADAATVSATP